MAPPELHGAAKARLFRLQHQEPPEHLYRLATIHRMADLKQGNQSAASGQHNQGNSSYSWLRGTPWVVLTTE